MKSFSQNNLLALNLRSTFLTLALLAVGAAQAALSDTLQPYVGAGYSYDDNLLRLPDGAGAQSDTIRQLYAGVSLDRTYGRQHFVANAKLTKVTYQHFDQLNYDGKDFSGTWYWAVGNDFDGSLGGSYVQTLSSFNDFHTSERNLRVVRTGYGDINYHLSRRWKVRARFNTDKFSYDLPAQRYLDRKEDGSELGFDYQTLAGSSIGLQARRLKGSYPYPRTFGGAVLDDAYTQNELKLKLLWKISEATQLQFLGGRVRRSHEAISVRNARGTNGRLTFDWAVLPQLKLTAAGWREFVPYEGISLVNYSLSKGESVGATWAASARVQYQAELRNVKRDFVGLLASNSSTNFNDTTRTASAGVTYMMRPNVQLGAQLSRDQRNGGASIFSSDYHAKGASVYANIQF